ncbi:MAG: hypothetical protein R3343_09115 [Nitriliruptorales bacterium]|nr:hypothetical protein [Nitriliruptorales bacterium]
MGRRRRRRKNRNNKQRNNQQQKNRNEPQRPDGPGFWGDPSKLPEITEGITITDDPHAVPRSLGEPPLPQKREIAGHYFEAIYERAINTAGALAAAGGLIDYEELSGTQS